MTAQRGAKTAPRITLTRVIAMTLLDTTVGRVRWYIRRACEIPEHLWSSFAILCWELGYDPNEIVKHEIKSPTQVWRA